MKFYRCEHCGNIITKIEDKGVNVVCCGDIMSELELNIDVNEKHTPILEQDGNNVVIKVGSVLHPMEEEHLIKWVAIRTEKGTQIYYLTNEPIVNLLVNEEIKEVYAYCNTHGLWKN